MILYSFSLQNFLYQDLSNKKQSSLACLRPEIFGREFTKFFKKRVIVNVPTVQYTDTCTSSTHLCRSQIPMVYLKLPTESDEIVQCVYKNTSLFLMYIVCTPIE
jgi:hypothetical protein